jgi:DNA-directed RNA polymerase specialized sigma24 family protein
MRMVHDESLGEETTQEVFLTLLNEVHRFDETRSSLSTSLCGIARHLVRKHLRGPGSETGRCRRTIYCTASKELC